MTQNCKSLSRLNTKKRWNLIFTKHKGEKNTMYTRWNQARLWCVINYSERKRAKQKSIDCIMISWRKTNDRCKYYSAEIIGLEESSSSTRSYWFLIYRAVVLFLVEVRFIYAICPSICNIFLSHIYIYTHTHTSLLFSCLITHYIYGYQTIQDRCFSGRRPNESLLTISQGWHILILFLIIIKKTTSVCI